MENGSKTLQCLTYNTVTNEALRPFHYDEQMKWDLHLLSHCKFLLAFALSPFFFFFPLAPTTSSYTVAFVISGSIAPLFLFRQRNLPSDWGITYSEEGGGTEPLPRVRVYL